MRLRHYWSLLKSARRKKERRRELKRRICYKSSSLVREIIKQLWEADLILPLRWPEVWLLPLHKQLSLKYFRIQQTRLRFHQLKSELTKTPNKNLKVADSTGETLNRHLILIIEFYQEVEVSGVLLLLKHHLTGEKVRLLTILQLTEWILYQHK
jgi:hypothetical protein